MAILLKIASVQVSSIQIMQVRVQNKGKSVWKSRYDGDVSGAGGVRERSREGHAASKPGSRLGRAAEGSDVG